MGEFKESPTLVKTAINIKNYWNKLAKECRMKKLVSHTTVDGMLLYSNTL